MSASLNLTLNPTDFQRHEMLQNSLSNAERPEDFDNIIRLLSPPPDITNYAAPGELRDVKIGIIGGGVAGMCTAYELRKLGANITILEASDNRIGGRVYTYYFDSGRKYYGELGAMWIPVSHETTWHYINLFGLNTLPLSVPDRNNFLYVHSTRLRTTDSIEEILYPKYDLTPQERNTSWSNLSEYAFSYVLKQLTPRVRTELISILPGYSPEYLVLMKQSVREVLEALGLSQGAISLISGVDPFTGSFLNISYDELLQVEYTVDFANIYKIEGGNVNLPIAFYNSFLNGCPSQYQDIPDNLLGNVSYLPGNYVTGIYQSAYRNKIILKYRNKREAKDIANIFDYVICTIPYSSLRTVEINPLFSNIKMQAIMEFNYIDAMKTLFLCNRRFWEENTPYGNIHGGISFTDLPIQTIVYPSNPYCFMPDGEYEQACSPKEPGVLTAAYNLTQDATRLGGEKERIRIKTIKQSVEKVHGLPNGYLNPIIQGTKILHWNEEPNFRGALAFALPGQKNLFSYQMLQPEYNQRLYFAGEHISAKHGWLQGSLYTAKLAANMVAQNYQSNR